MEAAGAAEAAAVDVDKGTVEGGKADICDVPVEVDADSEGEEEGEEEVNVGTTGSGTVLVSETFASAASNSSPPNIVDPSSLR